MSFNSRLGTAPEEGIKAPCLVKTTVNVTLSGLGSYAVNDRILVGAQTDPAENGIYLVQESAWVRSTDMNQSDDMITGMLVATVDQVIHSMTFTGDYNPGTTDLTVTSLPTSIAEINGLIDAFTYSEAEIDILIASREPADPTILKDADIDVTVQSYDAATAKTDEAANFTAGLQAGGSDVLVDNDIGSTVQAYDVDTAKTDVLQTYTVSQNGSVTASASLTIDCSTTNNHDRTPTGNGTLTFTNIAAGYVGNISFDNSGGHIISVPVGVWISSDDLTKLSVAGRYTIGVYAPNGTEVELSVSNAITAGGV